MCTNRTEQAAGSCRQRREISQAVRSLALQGGRIERTLRTLRGAAQVGSSAVSDCGCSGKSRAVKSVKVERISAQKEKDVTVDPEREARAAALHHRVLLGDRAMRRSYRVARTVVKSVEGLDFMNDPQLWRKRVAAFAASPTAQADTRRLLARYGFSIDVAQYVVDTLARRETPPQLVAELSLLKRSVKSGFATVATTSQGLTGDDVAGAIDDSPIDIGSDDQGNPTLSIKCEKLPPPLDVGCVIVVIGVIIAVAVMALVDWLEDLFNATDDDNARDTIARSTCEQLAALPLDRRLDMLRSMINGPTGDDDENAIAKLLECSSCADVQTMVGQIGLNNLIGEFQGEEWDRLMIRLQACGLVDFGAWDDDATRRFINDNDCATLNALDLNAIRQLILNMFSGSTGDDDENAIVKLVGCLPCSRRHQLMTMNDMSFDDFDDEVDGDEWDRLEDLLEC